MMIKGIEVNLKIKIMRNGEFTAVLMAEKIYFGP